ncbi:MAG: MFS transporter [Sphingomonas sp.]
MVDGQRFGRLNLILLIWSFFVAFTDGFEISSLGYAVPHIAREWQILPRDMGLMMSASVFGMLVGSPLLGLMGDRLGRRPTIIFGCVLFGITTLAVPLAQNVDQVTLLRFLTGIGMGGVLPNIIALSSESSPKHLRARLVILMFIGVPLGAAVPGLVTADLVPVYGWRAIFWVGGSIALIAGLVGPWVAPESVKFLATRPHRIAELRRTLARLRPDLVLPDDTQLVAERASEARKESIASLFHRDLAPITFLIWISFSMTLMANFFLASWLPSLLAHIDEDPRITALTASTFQLGAVLGSLAMGMLLDRFGYLAIGVLLLVASPLMLLVGVTDMPPLWLAIIIGCGGFCVIGAQTAGGAAAGILYSTAYRAQGLGMAYAIGRFGSILGPVLGAQLLGLPLMLLLFICVSLPLLIGALAVLTLAVVIHRRFGGWRLQEIPISSREHELRVSEAA